MFSLEQLPFSGFRSAKHLIWDSFLVLDLGLHVVNGVRSLGKIGMAAGCWKSLENNPTLLIYLKLDRTHDMMNV